MLPIRIAIIGAGPVGLMLARLLSSHPSIELVVFEADKSRTRRDQGGTLDLHSATGLAAIQEAGLFGKFLEHARFDGENLTICDQSLLKYVNITRNGHRSSRGKPEIDRGTLRDILLDSIRPDLIQWGSRLCAVEKNGDLVFDHGKENGFDLIVGADGAWSRVRKFLSTQVPEYSGITGYEWIIPEAEKYSPSCFRLVNRGSLFSHSEGRAIFAQQLGDGSLKIYTFTRWLKGTDGALSSCLDDTETIKKEVIKEFEHWDSQLLQFILDAQNPKHRPLYSLPVGWCWVNQPGVTLIGDAAHLMTPFGGEGVNIGLQDALKLSKEIIKASKSTQPYDSLQQGVKSFERDLYIRATKTTALTESLKAWMFFTDGSPRSIIEKLSLRMITFRDEGVLGFLRYPFIAAFVYIYFALFKLWYRGP